MEKLKQAIVEYLKSLEMSQEKNLLSSGYTKAINDAINQINKMNFYQFSDNMPSSEDVLADIELVENDKRKTISKEDAFKLFYYKLGWNRGEYRRHKNLINKAV